LQRRESEVLQAFHEIDEGISQLDEADLNCMELSLDAAHRLLQQMENQSPLLTTVQNEIVELQKSCSKEELETLTRKTNQLGQTSKVRHRTHFSLTLNAGI
jgi:hypothetical protein